MALLNSTVTRVLGSHHHRLKSKGQCYRNEHLGHMQLQRMHTALLISLSCTREENGCVAKAVLPGVVAHLGLST